MLPALIVGIATMGQSQTLSLEQARIYVDQDSLLKKWVWQAKSGGDTALKILADFFEAKAGRFPTAVWLGGWQDEYAQRNLVARAKDQGADTLLLELYNIQGAENSPDNYIAWLQGLARGSQGIRVIAGYETDAISLGSQLSDGHRLSRMALMRRGIQILQQAGWMVFPDAGGPFWPGYAVILKGLREVGASGFTVDVSGYEDLGECYRYGKRLSAEMGGVPWIIDGSRRRRDPWMTGWPSPPSKQNWKRDTDRKPGPGGAR
jgi:endoglucanase